MKNITLLTLALVSLFSVSAQAVPVKVFAELDNPADYDSQFTIQIMSNGGVIYRNAAHFNEHTGKMETFRVNVATLAPTVMKALVADVQARAVVAESALERQPNDDDCAGSAHSGAYWTYSFVGKDGSKHTVDKRENGCFWRQPSVHGENPFADVMKMLDVYRGLGLTVEFASKK